MKAIYKDYNELPLVMNAEHIANLMGISKANAYTLMHIKGFPILNVGKRMLVQRDAFFEWLNSQQQF